MMMMILLFLGEIHAYASNVILVTVGCYLSCENVKTKFVSVFWKTKMEFEKTDYLALDRCFNHPMILIDQCRPILCSFINDLIIYMKRNYNGVLNH